ncbi:HAD-IA family hydrolase [Paenibacillus sp. TRM 82003]|nr:HAD-IA family hydrolase [Paenibacillus sp. TRM 82003]
MRSGGRLVVGERAWDVEAIVFDKDGTLLDFAALWGPWAQRVMQRLNDVEPAADWASMLGVAAVRGELVHDPDGPLAMASNAQLHSLLTWRLYRAGRPWNVASTVAAIAMDGATQDVEADRPARATAGLAALLDACLAAGVRLGVATSDDTAMAERHLEWLGCRHAFGAVVGSDLVARGKPEPDMLLLACERLGVAPGRAVMIGDTLGDLAMGRAAGAAAAILIGERTGPVPPDADAVIRDFRDARLQPL